VPSRSLANYLLDFVPAALVAAVSVAAVPRAADEVPTRARRAWLAPLSVAVPAVAGAVLLVVAFSSAPLTVGVDGYAAGGVATVDGGLHYVRVDVRVTNTADRALTPRFMVSSGGGHPSGFWDATVVSGRVPIPPGGTTAFALRPTRYTPAPDHGARWLVEAYTADPSALSTSPVQYWAKGIPGQ
jgi:hypothetical protein